jgi:RNA polymerase sigma-70 factor (ECF subfamily)
MLLHAGHPIQLDDATRRERFRAMFEAEFDYVWRSLRRLGVDTRDLEDVSQDVFVQVYRRLEAYEPARPVRPWLFAFAFRCASDWRRLARHRMEVMVDPDQREAPLVAADDAIARTEDRDLVLQALAKIDLDRRAVLILHEFDECPMREIAEVLAVPLFTAYSRLRVAREEFSAAVHRLRVKRGDP